jgi:5'-3' exonuclease
MTLFAKDPPILAVDVANIAHRAYHANKHLSIGSGEDEKPTGHVYGAVKILLPLIKKYTKGGKQPELWWALEGSPKRRQKIYPEYKANRQRNFEPYPDVRKLVLRFPGVAFHHPRLEADDLLAVMTHPGMRGKRDIVLVTTDRDLWQFVGHPGIKVWCKDHVVNPVEMVATFGVNSWRSVALVKALFGDTTDNVPPAFKGMRHKPMLDLINEREIQDPADLKACLHELPEKAQERIEKGWEALERNWRLVKLVADPRMELRSRKGPGTPDKLVAYLEQFACKSLYEPVKELWPR